MKNHALKYTLSFAAAGVIILSFIFYVQSNMFKLYEHDLPYFNLGDNVKNKTSQARLLFEKALIGDRDVNFEKDVLQKLVASRDMLENAYAGGRTELGGLYHYADDDTKVALKEAIIDADNLIEILKERWTFKRRSYANPKDSSSVQLHKQMREELDREVEHAYAKFQKTIDRLNKHVRNIVSIDSDYLSTISWLSIMLILVVFGFLGALFYRLQRNNDSLHKETLARLDIQANIADQLSNFVEAVSEGNFSMDLALAGDDGSLTNKLITMRDKLKENAEGERKRGWSTMGMAQIGEILRSNTSNTLDLYDNIINFLVKYTNSNQGGLFILNDDDDSHRFLELEACVAFERKKYLSKRIELGEGLVGQCYLEAERVYLQDVPEEYIAIGSGLGGSKPKSLLLTPMKLDNKIFGVIELATFKSSYEDFEIELVEKLAETIASAISTVRVNYSTRSLLERTQQQAEEMRSQEEEIRQNMEELEATQEEMQRKNKIMEAELLGYQRQADDLKLKEKKLTESQETLQAIVDNIPRAIFWKDKDLKFAGCNKIFAQVAGATSYREVIGKSDFDMIWSAQAEAYRKDDLEVMNSRQAKLDIEEVNMNSRGEESWVMTSKVPIINAGNEVISILGMFEDITLRKKNDADIAKKLSEYEQALKEIQHLKRLLENKG